MKANEFVKRFGIDEAKSLVSAQSWTMRQIALSTTVDTKELTRLVESWELVALFDDIDCAKAWVSDLDSDWPYQVKGSDTKFFKWQLEQAIADVESCIGEG